MPHKSKMPLRHPAEGGYVRGEETRKRILETAIKVFAEKGYASASTRHIATLAGVNASALQYYFQNKEGMFNSCTEMLSEQNILALQPLLSEMHDAVKSGADDEQCIALLCALLESMLYRIYTMENSHTIHLFIAHIHLQQSPSKAFEILRKNLEVPLYDAIGSVVASLSRLQVESETVQLRVLSLLGLLNIFFTMRPTVLAQMHWNAIDAKRLADLIKVTRMHCTILSKSWIADT